MKKANNNGADQPVHPCSLISTFVIPCLDSIIPMYTCYSQTVKTLASFCSTAGWFESYLVANPTKTRLLVTWLIKEQVDCQQSSQPKVR